MAASSYTYKTRKVFKCGLHHQFSVTTGTIFASRKLPIRDYLLAIAIFVNGAKGHSALQLSRDLDCQYKTAFVLAHKLREAMAAERRRSTAGGEVEVDGAYFGGYVQAREPEREPRSIVASPRTKPASAASSSSCASATARRFRSCSGRRCGRAHDQSRVATGSTIYADEAAHWDALHGTFI